MMAGGLPPVIVAGFGRCGSSLVMQMLHAGGFPVTGEYPAFECEAYNSGGEPPPSGASKVLSLHRNPPPGGPYRWVWLDRTAIEQAKSQAKFLKLLCGIHINRAEVRAMSKSYSPDRMKCFAIMRRLGGSILTLSFEALLADPSGSAGKLAGFVGGIDPVKMAAVVRPRPPGCLPYLLEAELSAGNAL